MERVTALARHVLAARAPGQAVVAEACAGSQAPGDKREDFSNVLMEYAIGCHKLRTEGELPNWTTFELLLANPGSSSYNAPAEMLKGMLEKSEKKGLLKALDVLPGPWKEARTLEDKLELLRTDQRAQDMGNHLQLYAGYQLKYGDRGLASNIAVPTVVIHSPASCSGPEASKSSTLAGSDRLVVTARVILADPEDAARFARIHLRKEPNFGVLYNSIISTTDNDHWKAQRDHLTEVFLPHASLSHIMPTSFSRAVHCADRLAELTKQDSTVDMSDFLLHEAQAQLQLALLGMPEDFMDKTNADIRRTFMFHPDGKAGRLSEIMKEMMAIAKDDTSCRVPSDRETGGCPIRAPLTRALQTGTFPTSTDYGNMLLILFAGHDTTGHTMTWLLMELARNQALQQEVQKEVDGFWAAVGDRSPVYEDLARFDLLDRCITETLRLWPAVGNGTFRQLQFQDSVRGPNGSEATLPKGQFCQIINWSRHRNPDLWGPDADRFNPKRDFKTGEVAQAGCPMSGSNPQSDRFSPFAHNPRSCLGKNFAQMEMRLILSQLLRRFNFTLGPSYQKLQGFTAPTAITEDQIDGGDFRGVNRAGTMGPLDLERSHEGKPLVAMKLTVAPRHA